MTQPSFSQLIRTRQSCHRFGDNEISRETILEIIGETIRSPSAWNLQPWRFHVLESREAIEDAYEASYGQDFLLDASTIVLVTGDTRIDTHADDAFEDAFQKNYYTAEERDDSLERVISYSDRSDAFIEAFLDRQCAIAAYQIHLSAEARGLGSCIVRGFDADILAMDLDLADWERPEFLIPIGEDEEDRPQKMRVDRDAITKLH